MGRGLLCEVGAQASDQVVDFTAAVQAAAAVAVPAFARAEAFSERGVSR